MVPARFLTGELPADFVASHVRVLLPAGMDDTENNYALRGYKESRSLEAGPRRGSVAGRCGLHCY